MLFAFCFGYSSVHSSDDDGKPVVRKPSQTEGGQIVGKGGVVVSAVIIGLGAGQIVVAKSGGVIDERSDGGGDGGNLGDHVDGGGSLLGGQTAGGGVIKGGLKSGLGGGNVLKVVKVGGGDLLCLDVIVDGGEVSQAAGLGEVEGRLELCLGRLDLLCVLEILRSGGGDSNNKHLDNWTIGL